jgi:hypothetical protein
MNHTSKNLIYLNLPVLRPSSFLADFQNPQRWRELHLRKVSSEDKIP